MVKKLNFVSMVTAACACVHIIVGWIEEKNMSTKSKLPKWVKEMSWDFSDDGTKALCSKLQEALTIALEAMEESYKDMDCPKKSFTYLEVKIRLKKAIEKIEKLGDD